MSDTPNNYNEYLEKINEFENIKYDKIGYDTIMDTTINNISCVEKLQGVTDYLKLNNNITIIISIIYILIIIKILNTNTIWYYKIIKIILFFPILLLIFISFIFYKLLFPYLKNYKLEKNEFNTDIVQNIINNLSLKDNKDLLNIIKKINNINIKTEYNYKKIKKVINSDNDKNNLSFKEYF